MENIKTTNIISTPEITGNIGSCSVQSNETQVKGGIFTEQYRTIQINSCTGEIVSNQVYTSYGGVWIFIIFSLVMVGFVLGVYFESN